MLLRSLDVSSFEVQTRPPPAELGRLLQSKGCVVQPVLQLRFGDLSAGLPIRDVWAACCELDSSGRAGWLLLLKEPSPVPDEVRSLGSAKRGAEIPISAAWCREVPWGVASE